MDKNQETQEVEEALDLPEEKEGEEDTTDWKAEAKKLQEKAIKQREKTKELKAKLKAQPTETKPADQENKSGDLDFGEKAYLKSMLDIKGADEIALVKQWRTRTGDDLDTLVSDDIFLSKLTSLREARTSQEAIPSGTRRSNASTKDSVEFHLEKYENGSMKLNDMDFDMRSKVLTAKLEKDKKSSTFNFNGK